MRSRPGPTASTTSASTRCTPCGTAPTSTGSSPGHLDHVVVVPVARHPSRLPRRRLPLRAGQLQRGAAVPHAQAAVRGPRRSEPDGPPRLLLARVSADYAAAMIGRVPFILEVNPQHAVHPRRQSPPPQRGPPLVRGGDRSRRDAARRHRCRRSVDRRADRRTDTERRHDPARHRLDPIGRRQPPERPPRPGRAHRAPVRPDRRSRPRPA